MADGQLAMEAILGRQELPGEDILNGRAEAPAPDSAPVADDKPESTGAEAGATPAPDKEAPEVDEVDDADPHPVPRKSLIAERKKRQEYERQVAEMKGRLDAYEKQLERGAKQQPRAQQAEDPDAAFYSNPTQFIDQRLRTATLQTRIDLSAEMMRSSFPDYAEMESTFVSLAQQNPELVNQMHASPNPARFAYEYAKTYKEVDGVGSIGELRKKIAADVRKELDEEYRKKAALSAADRASTSNATARGSGANSRTFAGARPLSEIFKKRA